KKLEPLFRKVLPLEKINKLLARDQGELKKLLKKRSPETAKAFAAADDRFRRGLANRREALEVLATTVGSMLNPPTYVAVDPFLIWAQPSNILVDSHIEHLSSWAKVYYDLVEHYSLGYSGLTFYYVWRNPSGSPTVVNAQCSLLFRGACYVEG